MTIDTLHYYPRHIQEMREYIRLTAVVDLELLKVWDAIRLIEANMFLDTMDEDTLLRHENFLGIIASPIDTLDDRRRRIKGYFASNLPYTEKKLTEILTAMCGEDNFELVIDTYLGTVDINIRLNSIRLVENCYDVIRKAAPADMIVKAKILYNTHGRLRSLTHEQLGRYTHYQLRNESIFPRDLNTHNVLGRYRNSQLAAYKHKQLMEDELNGS